MDAIKIKIETNFWKLLKKKQPQAPLAPHPYADYYDMNKPNRGTAVILNHVTFDASFLTERKGSNKDRDDLKNLFNELGFNVISKDDATVLEMHTILRDVSQMDHSKSDCLIVVVMTHGETHKLYARDGLYYCSRLWRYFSAKSCPSLAGKPKLFFIQACRGGDVHEKFTVRYQAQGIESDADPSQEEIFYSIPVYADILVMYSTMEGLVSWRDPYEGSYFIQSLVRHLREHYAEKDLLTILTFVNREVAIEFTSEEKHPKYTDTKQMCSIVSMLTRLVRF